METKELISLEAITRIVGLDEDLIVDHKEMAKHVKLTVYPYEGKVSDCTRVFFNKLMEAFIANGVTIVPFEEALVKPGQKAIKKGIHIVALGEQEENNMPIEYLTSYRDNLILTVIDEDRYVKENFTEKEYKEQADYGISKITWNFSNFVVGVDDGGYWIPYGSTGLNDVYKTDYEGTFQKDVLTTLISKLYAPINAIPLSEFTISEKGFDGNSPDMKPYLDDLAAGSRKFEDTNLINYHFTVDDMPFKKEAYKKLYTIMLDNRKNVHFGYLSRQLPVTLSKVYRLEDAEKEMGIDFGEKDYTYVGEDIYVKLELKNETVCLKVPEIETLTSISGTDKLNIQYTDVVKMGLKNGKMSLQFAEGIDPVKNNVRPSFDTKVILSNAVSTAIFASVLKYINPDAPLPKIMENQGIALGHWHGYVNPDFIPKGWEIYGSDFPVFMCSAQQAAAYGFFGKARAFAKHFNEEQKYHIMGDVHIEPDHGVNVTWESLEKLALFLCSSEHVAKVGTQYFSLIRNI